MVHPEVHAALHRLLHYALLVNGFPAPDADEYEKLMKSPQNGKGKKSKRTESIHILLNVTKYVDKTCKAMSYRNYQELTPALKIVLKRYALAF
jgi:hypothetical protein